MPTQPEPTVGSNPGPKWGYHPGSSCRYGLYRIMQNVRWPIALITFSPVGIEHENVIMDMIVAALNEKEE